MISAPAGGCGGFWAAQSDCHACGTSHRRWVRRPASGSAGGPAGGPGQGRSAERKAQSRDAPAETDHREISSKLRHCRAHVAHTSRPRRAAGLVMCCVARPFLTGRPQRRPRPPRHRCATAGRGTSEAAVPSCWAQDAPKHHQACRACRFRTPPGGENRAGSHPGSSSQDMDRHGVNQDRAGSLNGGDAAQVPGRARRASRAGRSRPRTPRARPGRTAPAAFAGGAPAPPPRPWHRSRSARRTGRPSRAASRAECWCAVHAARRRPASWRAPAGVGGAAGSRCSVPPRRRGRCARCG